MSHLQNNRVLHLESLRGIAAIVVVIHHCVLSFWPGIYGKEESPSIFQKIIINSPFSILYNGQFAVYIFFMLSGYVLSIKFFQTRNSNIIRILMLKRYVRLSVPILAASLLGYFMWEAGLFTAESAPVSNWLKSFFKEDDEFSFVDSVISGLFKTILLGEDKYDYVLWTMKIEFWGSILVFANCLLLKGLRNRIFLYAIQALIIIGISGSNSMAYICFLAGMAIADSGPLSIKGTTGWLLLILSIFLATYFTNSESHEFLKSFFYLRYGSINITPTMLCYSIGSFVLLLLTLYFAPIKTAIDNPIGHFLGKISFPLYLTHAFVLSSIGALTLKKLVQYLPFDIAALASTLVTVAGSLLLAWGFRPIDDLAAYTSKWFSSAFIEGPSKDAVR
ncbi:acyltransferase family protein [Brucella tritici]|nr:acyltransferase [Brucella tritici]